MKSVFDQIDAQKWNIKGFSPFAVLQNARTWRRYFFLCAIAAGACWALMGFDSTWSMLMTYVEQAVPLLRGEITFAEVTAQSRLFYGTGNRFSSPVIYSLAFITLSLHLEKHGIVKSANFFVTSALSLMSIGLFELAYNMCYSHFQFQPWTMQFVWKQVTNLSMFTLFSIIGITTIVYLYCEDYRLNWGKRTQILTVAAIGFWMLWIFYPFHFNYISVQTTDGWWTSGARFPQTMYAVDIDPLDGVAIGVPYFVENNLIHAVNTLTKIVSTAAILSLCCGSLISRRDI